jgi:hypothetical protein
MSASLFFTQIKLKPQDTIAYPLKRPKFKRLSILGTGKGVEQWSSLHWWGQCKFGKLFAVIFLSALLRDDRQMQVVYIYSVQ